jgi:hypothetical protein
MWWYLWKQKPIGPINLSVSTHLILSPKLKIRKRKYHPFKKNTTKYYYYIYLYDKTKKIIIMTQLLAWPQIKVWNWLSLGVNSPVKSANLGFLAEVTLMSIYILWFMFWSMAITALRNSGPFVNSFLYFFKFIAFTSLIPPTTFLISNEKIGHFVSDRMFHYYPISVLY